MMRYGVDKNIGRDLVRFEELNLRRKDGRKVGYTPIKRVEDTLHYPWWLVHRHHLHQGLTKTAQENGVTIHMDSRVAKLQEQRDGSIKMVTEKGKVFVFDLVVGADGVQSIVRRTLFPDVTPKPLTGNAAFRAIVPYDEVRADPVTRELVENENGELKMTMDVWMAPGGYIISYPISDGKDFNMVLSHHVDPPVSTVQEVSIEEVRNTYKGYDPRIERIVSMIKPPISRWPLLVTGPLESWSNASKNVVLMGDAAHSMVNHMAQGAATSMEDGAFLARCIRAAMERKITLRQAVEVYERGRMPKASYKQQVSFLNGAIWMQPDGPATHARDKAMALELQGETPMRSPNLYGDPTTVLECYDYDAERHADEEIATFLNQGSVVRDDRTKVTRPEADRIVNWYLPEGCQFEVKPKL